MKEQLERLVKKWRSHADACHEQMVVARNSGGQAAAGVWAQEAMTNRGNADELESLLTPEPRFVPGMKIGPGHGRPRDVTLEEFKGFTSCTEVWKVKEFEKPWQDIYPDDRDRVLYDPRKHDPEGSMKKAVPYSTRQPASQWKNGQKEGHRRGHLSRFFRKLGLER